jgi:hypothetical protein
MRIVHFTSDRVTVYPFEGASSFGKTYRIGNEVVGEYTGNATSEQLPDYKGKWPIPPAREFQTVMDAQRFLQQLTREELIRLYKSTDPLVQDTVILFQMRNGEVNVESQIFADVVVAAVADGLLTQGRADELSKGIPL